MSPEAMAVLDYNLSHPRADWALPPMLPGVWTERTGDDARDIILAIDDALPRNAVPLSLALHIDRVRTRNLACHGGVLLMEMQGYAPQPGLFSAIIHQAGILHLDGQSIPLHYFNRDVDPALDTDEARMDYVLLFMNWVHGAEIGGRFQPLVGDAVFSHRAPPGSGTSFEMVDAHRADTITFSETESEEGVVAWDFSVNLLYGSALFTATMRLHGDGKLDMVDDEMILEFPLLTEQMQGRLLRLTPNVSGITAL